MARLLFVGTGAADWPQRRLTAASRAHASALLDGRVLLDCTGSGLRRLRRWGVNLNAITDVFLTHGHGDHFDPEALGRLAALRREQPLRVHGHGALGAPLDGLPVQFDALTPGRVTSAAGWTVQALGANHPGQYPGEAPLHYLFLGAVRFLYATDGAWMTAETFRTLRKTQLHAAVFDATIGDGHRDDPRIFEHNSLDMVWAMTAALRAAEILLPGAPVLLTHLARTLHPAQAQLQASLEPQFVAAYDGLEVSLGD